ncbi:MAG: ChaN family lipoprotein [Thermodesulfobacteriota bacterium]|nr:ChaN family lipoprotein [Thermodesulfobacteriota bacterium]
MILQRHTILLLAALMQLLFFSTQLQAAPSMLTNKLTLSFDVGNHSLTGISRFDLPGGRELNLHTGDLTVTRIEINGNEMDLQPDSDKLIQLKKGAEPRSVVLHYEKKFPQNNGQTGSIVAADGIVLLGLWHPVANEDLIFQLSATIPTGFSAVSEADEISYTDLADCRKVAFSFTHPLSRLHFIAGPYLVREETFSNGKILATYFFPEDEALAKPYADKTRQYLQRYENLLGEYPYKRFSVVENRLPTGFAMPTFTLLGQAVVRMPFILDTSLGHEVLHSWFGNSIGVDDSGGNWCEGLTSYLADQAFAADAGKGADFRKNQLIFYQSHVPADNTMTVQDFKGAVDHLKTARHIRGVGYNKNSMLFHMLRKKIGDQPFFTALQDFYGSMKYKRASWTDLQSFFAKVTKEDLSPFFEQWLTRTDIPHLELEDLMVKEEDGRPLLIFNLVQKNEEPYQLDLPIRIDTGQKSHNQSVKISRKKTRITIPLESMPKWLTIDPDYDIMRHLVHDELPAVWSRFMGAKNKIGVVAKEDRQKFVDLIPLLEEMDCQVVNDDEVDDTKLKDHSLIFLGIGSQTCRSLFGRPIPLEGGFVLEVRENPMNPAESAVLVTAKNQKQILPVLRKLRHYGKYGFLLFEDGKIRQKIIPESDQGMIFLLDEPPRGMAVSQARDFSVIMNNMAKKRIIYVAESHTSEEDHALQLRIIRAMHERDPRLAIGMEMFNRDVQEVLDQFTRGSLDEKDFLKKSKYFTNWGFDYRLYRDILQFARRHHIPVIALNLDKQIVSDTFKKDGIAGLDSEVKATLPPDRDLGKPGYRQRLEGVFNHHSGTHFTKERLNNFIQSQSLWDETMAEAIADYLKNNPDKKMVVLAGGGHMVKDTGIPPRVYERLAADFAVAANIQPRALDDNEADFLFFPVAAAKNPSPLLGIQIKDKDGELVIVGFSPMHSVAKKAGIEKDDRILAINGTEVEGIEDVKIGLVFKEKGDTVTLRVWRERRLLPDLEIDIEVVL